VKTKGSEKKEKISLFGIFSRTKDYVDIYGLLCINVNVEMPTYKNHRQELLHRPNKLSLFSLFLIK